MAAGHTYDQLAARSGLSKEAVAHWLKPRRALGTIYIERWADDPRGHPVVPVFRWGAGKDAPRPGRRLTPAQQMAKMRARRRAEAEGPVSLEDML